MKPEEVVKIGLGIFGDAMPRAEPTALLDCIREQEWLDVAEREQIMKEITAWWNEYAKDRELPK